MTTCSVVSRVDNCPSGVFCPAQVVDARAGPGFKVTKPKKVKNSDGKKKSKLKKLHKFKRQSKQF